jgi:hypothetical protein
MLAFGIKETTATTGTGTLTLSSVSGFPRFADKFAVGASVSYAILDSNGAPLEIGIGTVGSSNTLSRYRILATYASATYNDLTATAVSLSGTNTVICTGAPSSFFTAYPNVNTVITSSGSAPQRLVMDSRINTNSASSTGLTMSANNIYLVPFFNAFQCIASGIALRIGTGVAGKSIIAGLYRLDHRGYPAKLIGETASTAAATSGVNWSASFSGGKVALEPGMYVIGLVSDGTPAIGAVTGTAIFNPFGVASGQNIISVTSYLNTAHTFGALPNPAPTVAAPGAAVHVCAGLVID